VTVGVHSSRVDKRVRSTNLILVASAVVLFLAGTAYLARGVYFAASSAADYRLRWTEQQYVFRGKNPSSVMSPNRLLQSHQQARNIPPDDDLGISIGGYPPWAYFTGAAFAWPSSLVMARWYFAAINLLLLALLMVWAGRLGWAVDKRVGLLFAAALLATSSICTTLGLGQYGVVVLAALVGAWRLDGRDRWFLAGCILGVAMIKVTLAGPFLLPFVFRRRWKTVVTALAYIGVGSLVMWPIIDASPITVLNQMLGTSEFYVGDRNLVALSVERGMSAGDAIKMTAVATTIAAMVLLYVWRSASMLVLFAVAGMAARIWTYHNHYDNLIVVFLMLALGVHGLRHKRWSAWAGFVVVGLSLWFPARLTQVQAYHNFQWVAWCAGLALLLILEWPGSRLAQRPPEA